MAFKGVSFRAWRCPHFFNTASKSFPSAQQRLSAASCPPAAFATMQKPTAVDMNQRANLPPGTCPPKFVVELKGFMASFVSYKLRTFRALKQFLNSSAAPTCAVLLQIAALFSSFLGS
jgi:hypothetical protein